MSKTMSKVSKQGATPEVMDGEWEIVDAGGGTLNVHSDGRMICYLASNWGNPQANARLIAASPVMYETLQRIRSEAEAGNTKTIIGLCNEAIEKAEKGA